MPAKPDLTRRAEEAEELLRRCRLCPRMCEVDRLAGEQGYCGLTAEARCFREVLHYGEESELVPSHQIFFSGCNLRCEFCAVMEWNESPLAAPPLNEAQLRRCILRRKREGSRNMNFLGGEPTVSLPGILKLLSGFRPGLPVVWNSNMYFADASARLLDGVVDLYLADLKCGSAQCAARLLGARDYVEVVQENLRFARKKADVILRHLVLPGHRKCCLEPALRWIKAEMPDVKLSLRRDYLPPAAPKRAPANVLSEKEWTQALDYATKLGLNLVT